MPGPTARAPARRTRSFVLSAEDGHSPPFPRPRTIISACVPLMSRTAEAGAAAVTRPAPARRAARAAGLGRAGEASSSACDHDVAVRILMGVFFWAGECVRLLHPEAAERAWAGFFYAERGSDFAYGEPADPGTGFGKNETRLRSGERGRGIGTHGFRAGSASDGVEPGGNVQREREGARLVIDGAHKIEHGLRERAVKASAEEPVHEEGR